MEQPGEGHGHGVVGKGSDMDKGSHQWWVWGPLVLMLVLIFVLVADLFTDKSSPVQPFLYFAEIALAVAGMFWELMLRKTHK